MLDNHRIEHSYDYQFKKCPFYLRYQRTEPNDKCTPYLLTEFDMTHSHPLGLHIMHYEDVMIKGEIKRRTRNEYVMFEKNEVRINTLEFRDKN
jgi:hypothetical protein